MSPDTLPPSETAASEQQALMPEVVDHVAVARLYGEPLFAMPQDLYIPPDALEVFLEAFEGPLDLARRSGLLEAVPEADRPDDLAAGLALACQA